MSLIRTFTLLGGLIAFAVSALATAPAASPTNALSGMPIWQDYKAAFVRPDGRVVDNVNGGISHSEGQGYGMVLALAAGDRQTFARMFAFARHKLAVRDDALFAWRYDGRASPPVPDRNNASDGDLLIAWALLEAAAAGWGDHYQRMGKAILADLKPLIVADTPFGTVILPGEHGFVDDDGNITINPSYWVYPALERLHALTGDQVWSELGKSGASKQRVMTSEFSGLVPDWLTIHTDRGTAGISKTMSPNFGYEAIRVPLYSLWSTTIANDDAANIVQSAKRGSTGRVQLVDLSNGGVFDAFVDPGYAAIAHLSACATGGHKLPENVKTDVDTNYYPATLQMLTLVAVKTRYPQCM